MINSCNPAGLTEWRAEPGCKVRAIRISPFATLHSLIAKPTPRQGGGGSRLPCLPDCNRYRYFLHRISPLAHLLVLTHVSIGEPALRFEQDGYSHSCKCKADQNSGYYEELDNHSSNYSVCKYSQLINAAGLQFVRRQGHYGRTITERD